MSEKKPFRDRTEAAIDECGNWLKKNASDLADVFSGGCQNWSIEFSWDTMTDSGGVPEIDIRARKIDRDIIHAAIDFVE